MLPSFNGFQPHYAAHAANVLGEYLRDASLSSEFRAETETLLLLTLAAIPPAQFTFSHSYMLRYRHAP